MIHKSDFVPAAGLSNPHLQTIIPSVMRALCSVNYINERVELADGDFIELAWSDNVLDERPVVIIFHGLQGSVDSAYVKGIMKALSAQGMRSVLMHFRGCSGRLNRLPRGYHSGDTADARYIINRIKQQNSQTRLAAIGYSLGANMLLKLLGEWGSASPVEVAVSVSPPLVLADCADRLEQNASRFYQYYLIRQLKRNLIMKSDFHDYKALINLDANKIKTLNSFWQFDNHVTAPLHGFCNVHDYYEKSSSRQYLHKINSPTLIVQALDDPFMSIKSIPRESELSPHIRLELSQFGGHVGFISGHLLKPCFWLEKRIPEFLAMHLQG